MDFVPNSVIAEWYGRPCTPPKGDVRLKRIKVCGSYIYVNAKAVRAFRFLDWVFRTQTPEYYKDLNERHLDDWGYDCRPVTGTSDTWSKHAFGVAADCDADENVRGVALDKSEMWIKGKKSVKILEATMFTWGGRFGTPDTHHFEVARNKAWLDEHLTPTGRPKLWYRKQLKRQGLL